jgi:hypothetical protein
MPSRLCSLSSGLFGGFIFHPVAPKNASTAGKDLQAEITKRFLKANVWKALT